MHTLACSAHSWSKDHCPSKRPTTFWRLQVQFLEDCSGCNFVVQMWSHVVGLYDYTLLLEYCPYGSLDKLLMVRGHRGPWGV